MSTEVSGAAEISGNPRALDWRYYLSDQTWERVIIGQDAPADLVEAIAGLARRVDRFSSAEHPGDGSSIGLEPADLVILADTELDVIGHLARDGRIGPATVVVALDAAPSNAHGLRRAALAFRRTAPSLGRAARRVGVKFDELLVLRSVRTGSGAAFYYPSENAGARRYVWSTLAPATSRKGRLARIPLGRAGWTLASQVREKGLAIAGPACTLVEGARQTILVLTGYVQTNPVVAIEVPDTPQPPDAPPPAMSALRVVKIPREPGFSAMLAREQSKLATLQRILPGTPVKPLGQLSWGGQARGWAQTAFRGIPLGDEDWALKLDQVQRLAVWLYDLEQATSRQVSGGGMRPPEIGRWAQSIARSAQAAFSLRPLEKEHLEGLAVRLRKAGISLTFAHRDAGPWNILSAERQAVLIDWESAGWGLPGEDLLYLLLYMFASWSGASTTEARASAFRSQFVDPSCRPAWLADILLRLRRDLDVDSQGFRDVLATTLLSHALRIHHLGRSARGKAPLNGPFLEFWREVVLQGDRP